MDGSVGICPPAMASRAASGEREEKGSSPVNSVYMIIPILNISLRWSATCIPWRAVSMRWREDSAAAARGRGREGRRARS